MIDCPYGEWPSPITTELVTHGVKKFGNIVIDGDKVYWEEQRPSEGGKTFIVNQAGDVTSKEFSVRTRVHEYGGGAFTVHGGIVYFVNDKDQRIYVGNKPLTAEGVRFADLLFTEQGLVAVGEKGEENFLALINLTSGAYQVLSSGSDFYASPKISPDGKKLAWISWNHPNMPWDGTELWVADLHADGLKNLRSVAGGKTESIFQPEWSPEGVLHYVSDRSGWWNLYKDQENLHPLDAEFGMPQWTFGMSTYGFVGNQILCTYQKQGRWHLAYNFKELSLPGSFYTQIRTGKDFAAFILGSPTEARSVVRLNLKTLALETLARNEKPPVDPGYFSIAQPISFPSKKGRTAYGLYYPPKNKDCRAPKGELPPLIVKAHGGPTACANAVFDLSIQYWTSRGFAVLDVNYGGSTGYGRAYRELLKGNWGVVDIEDCEHGAKYLVEKGLVDPKKLAISGGSAGGYTTLCALTFGKTFTVGASYYGICDLIALAEETHKFEKHDHENLIASYPEHKDLYISRSPLYFPEKLNCPVIFFQGLEDKIVLPNQSEMMYEALKKRGILTELITYPGEQHGFRKAENIRDSLERELAFYLLVFRDKGKIPPK
jgi:dipeptidyl aminopeptidase/acylaminoacyl peptidase